MFRLRLKRRTIQETFRMKEQRFTLRAPHLSHLTSPNGNRSFAASLLPSTATRKLLRTTLK